MNMRNATCVRTQTSKDPTRVAILFISYSMPRRLVQFWQNLQTSLVLLIPNCTRQRMITHTNCIFSKQTKWRTGGI